ncbi:RsmB/NOP family class I SAM-dependent RNA methyltransferase [Marivita hallyeonensis]|uniref:16S rRNA (Cytosine967-C5)-methyltransferase n=1 Tax=Marivita hallyeonensis TaxID=996342 RepID=A0A1M5QQA0_9RHOB|nr:RsmB/NOP family class I SAM-dependent RNA methyltransferase [Marivita hallyeonensis]SHH16126.1 16S rRNA (cytosine967-C5)-methyltransferase [Marivita hallyeonensis]
MTPAARWAAAAQIMDEITDGVPAEKALTNWARRSRFAGSKDRAAVRDHVFDILRCWRSVAVLGGGTSGRELVLGRVRQTGLDVDTVFTGDKYGLAPLSDAERNAGDVPSGAAAADLPDWIYDIFRRDLGDDAHATAEAVRSRAAVFLRVNTLKADRTTAQNALSAAGIDTRPHDLSPTALEVVDGARRIAQSGPYLDGLVELQDVSSQAVVDALPLQPGQRVLDYCAGGGGKTLAMAARLRGPVDAHDADPRRMSDLTTRAQRAGADIRQVAAPTGLYDLVLCDVPCSGSGSWRRSPEGKWRLTEARLSDLHGVQASILDRVAPLVKPDGALAYATCSVLKSENEVQIQRFLSTHPEWICAVQHRFSLISGGDGFFLAILRRVGKSSTT